jgi:MFS family permease
VSLLIAVALTILLMHRRFSQRSTVMCAIAIALSPVLAFQSLNGLETGLSMLLVMFMLYAFIGTIDAIKSKKNWQGWTLLYGVAWLLGGMTRPEFVLLGLLICFFGVSLIPPPYRRKWLVLLTASFVLPGAVYFILRWWYFGHLLPLPFYAKHAQGPFSYRGLGYVALGFLSLLGGMVVLALLGYFRVFRDNHQRSVLGMLFWPAFLMCFVYVFFNPIMGFAHRFLIPYFLPLLISAAIGLDALLSDVDRKIRILGKLAASVAVLQIVGMVIPSYHYSRIYSVTTTAYHQGFGEMLASLPGKGRLATFNDVGGPAFFSDWDTVEGAGLVTPEISIGRMSDEELVASWKPDVIVHSGCPMDSPHAGNRFQGYRFVRAIPWLIFPQGFAGRGQCVYVNPTYAYVEQLETAVTTVGAPPIPDLWYLRLYFFLKEAFRQ